MAKQNKGENSPQKQERVKLKILMETPEPKKKLKKIIKKEPVKSAPKPALKAVVKPKQKSVKPREPAVPRRERIESGIINFDQYIEGGFKSNSINLLVGGAGSGKTIFAIQFLLEGLKQGEACLYLTFEEKKEKLYSDVKSFSWQLSNYEKKEKFFFLEFNPEQVKSLIEEGGGSIELLIEEHKVSRIVIDSITSFSLLYQDELARKEAALALFELINKWNCTAVLTSQAIMRDNVYETGSLEFEADSIIIMYHYKVGKERQRALEILKMRGTKHTNKTLKLEITEKGLVVGNGQTVPNKGDVSLAADAP